MRRRRRNAVWRRRQRLRKQRLRKWRLKRLRKRLQRRRRRRLPRRRRLKLLRLRPRLSWRKPKHRPKLRKKQLRRMEDRENRKSPPSRESPESQESRGSQGRMRSIRSREQWRVETGGRQRESSAMGVVEATKMPHEELAVKVGDAVAPHEGRGTWKEGLLGPTVLLLPANKPLNLRRRPLSLKERLPRHRIPMAGLRFPPRVVVTRALAHRSDIDGVQYPAFPLRALRGKAVFLACHDTLD